jgi:glycosyltransferase involved in cell wall biosynthesis
MKILFVHNNFPGQFRHLAQALARDPKMTIVGVGSATSRPVPGVRLVKYSLNSVDVSATHPFARRFDVECYRAEQVLYSLTSLVSSGFIPDVIVAHPGWGETLPLRTIFPHARILLYCEFFYGTEGRDVGFDPEFPQTGADGKVALHLKNAATLLALNECDVGLSPTLWQRSTYPEIYKRMIRVVHEGVDTDVVRPTADAMFRLSSGRSLRREDEVVTFVARNLEPLRGYHIFMRSLPKILRERPRAQILVIGEDRTYYGASPPAGKTWKSIFLNEVRDRIDSKRVHFTGRLAYGDYLKALQVSSAHVYLTYPFVLSWSCIEALSCGCVVIGSDTSPVREVINGENGVLVPFFDHEQLANRAIEALAQPRRFRSMRAAARRTAVEQFDLQTISLPQTMALLREGETPQGPKASEITPDSEARVAARKQRPPRRIGRSNSPAAALRRRRC